ncbi:hypothetical protein, conserved in T. vivax [Trypanosoma vivax Y486]|uniref:Uncharacterized protein n=1 Tax=Trypanosoma vivax (strain Y486) TaxID=1055687 RepID=F9WLI9_TRYVY|nr:hypothetical protein, conserved in T. vivax [Trypanosoma vivax Y486]|eukprot:CCD18381.1 hypothetical protein, conserved in T. vivax [Trypanosoma vivax Y486]
MPSVLCIAVPVHSCPNPTACHLCTHSIAAPRFCMLRFVPLQPLPSGAPTDGCTQRTVAAGLCALGSGARALLLPSRLRVRTRRRNCRGSRRRTLPCASRLPRPCVPGSRDASSRSPPCSRALRRITRTGAVCCVWALAPFGPHCAVPALAGACREVRARLRWSAPRRVAGRQGWRAGRAGTCFASASLWHGRARAGRCVTTSTTGTVSQLSVAPLAALTSAFRNVQFGAGPSERPCAARPDLLPLPNATQETHAETHAPSDVRQRQGQPAEHKAPRWMYQFAKNGHSDNTDGDTFTAAKRAETRHQARHATAPRQTPYPKRRASGGKGAGMTRSERGRRQAEEPNFLTHERSEASESHTAGRWRPQRRGANNKRSDRLNHTSEPSGEGA